MTQISVTIMCEPVAKGRPRMAVIQGRAMAYTPQTTRNAQAMIQALIREEVLRYTRFDAGVALILTATFFRERPKSLPKRVVMPVQKPDYDNYAKLLCDALEGYLFPNDSQICTAVIKKRFAAPGTPPRIELTITEDRDEVINLVGTSTVGIRLL